MIVEFINEKTSLLLVNSLICSQIDYDNYIYPII